MLVRIEKLTARLAEVWFPYDKMLKKETIREFRGADADIILGADAKQCTNSHDAA